MLQLLKCYAECRYAECRYAEWHYTDCRSASQIIASILLISYSNKLVSLSRLVTSALVQYLRLNQEPIRGEALARLQPCLQIF